MSSFYIQQYGLQISNMLDQLEVKWYQTQDLKGSSRKIHMALSSKILYLVYTVHEKIKILLRNIA